MKNKTTIQIEKNTLSKLKEIKKYPRETHEEVLLRLIKQEIEK
jgi:predicted CopG family antitoxin